jgi:thioredoxin-like negative regulator of GroEL
MIAIQNESDLNKIINENEAVLAYFSHDRCNVCKTLKPKLTEELTKNFPKLTQVYVDIEKLPETAAQHQVFTVPVILIFFEGKESYRKARNVGIGEITDLITRPYALLFE